MDRRLELDAALEKVRAGATAASLESSTLEFKEDKAGLPETLEAATAAVRCLANADGGFVVVGVANDVTGPAAFTGTRLTAAQLQRHIFDHSRPPLTVDATGRVCEGKPIVIVTVPRSPEVHSDPKGRVQRRVGTDCLPLPPNEVARLRNDRLGVDWSRESAERPPSDVDPAAFLSLRVRLSTLADSRRNLARLSDADLLAALGLVDERKRLLRAGELLLCRPTGAEVAIIYQYRLTQAGEPRTIERLQAPLLLALQRVMELLQARRNLTPVNLPDGQQIQIEDFPDAAVREAVVNAVMHRDHQLSGPVVIEHSPEVLAVTSPGPLVSGVTVENILTHPSKPRHPALAAAIRLLGFAEEIGHGVDRMFREMIRCGKDVPRIEDFPDRVRVTLVGGAPKTQIARFAASLPEEERDDTDTMLVLYRLCSTPRVTAADLVPVLQKTVDEAEAALRRLAGPVGVLEPTRQTARRAHPQYRLRGEVLKALGPAVAYQRRTMDEIDRKVIAHVVEYRTVTNRTVQNLLDVALQRARAILADLVARGVLVKTSAHERGPGVEYGPGPRFPWPARSSRPGTKAATRRAGRRGLR